MKRTYKVDGMTCGGCSGAVQRAVAAKTPGAEVTVDLATKAVTVVGAHDAEVVRAAVEGAGFDFGGAADPSIKEST